MLRERLVSSCPSSFSHAYPRVHPPCCASGPLPCVVWNRARGSGQSSFPYVIILVACTCPSGFTCIELSSLDDDGCHARIFLTRVSSRTTPPRPRLVLRPPLLKQQPALHTHHRVATLSLRVALCPGQPLIDHHYTQRLCTRHWCGITRREGRPKQN